ncbi:MAG TPA: LuxR C-terminal-related transcriptional regulator, partial [Acidimicrobiia bacterium]|nr:LuxR C-terminal-related transcriptional regulator [Acidimicrobiia bacterium]
STPVTLALGHLLAGAVAVEDEAVAAGRDHLATARLLAAPLLDGRVGAALATARADVAIAERDLDAATAAVDEGIRKVAYTGDDEALAHLCLLGMRVEAQRDADALGRASERSRTRRAGRIRGYERHIDRVLAAAPAGVDRPELRAIDLTRLAECARLDDANDPAAWRASADAWDAVQLPRWAAYAKTRLAEALVATGAPSADVELAFSRAVDAAHAIDSRRALSDVARIAQRAGVSLPETVPVTGVPEPALDIGGLTPREREVLDLVVEGATNKQIANRLFISEKTASVHVSRILTKLGATSRQEAAALARRARQR